MTNLILGASGNIGVSLSKKNKSTVFTYNSKRVKGAIKFDIRKDNISKLVKKYKINSVAYLSAISDPNFCYKYKLKSRNINIIKTVKILNYFIKKNIYFIFFSSEFVFDGKKKNYNEKDKTNPVNEYGRQKLFVEKYITSNAKNYAIFRIAKTYSSELNDRTLISDFISKIISGNKKFNVAYDQIFSPLYAGDLSKILNLFLKRKFTGIYNVCGSEKLSRYQIYNIIRNNLNRKLKKKILITKTKLNNFKYLDKRPLNVSMNNKKIKKILNFKFSKFSDISKKVISKSKINEKFD